MDIPQCKRDSSLEVLGAIVEHGGHDGIIFQRATGSKLNDDVKSYKEDKRQKLWERYISNKIKSES